jgi:hypothetical protein
MKPQHTRGDAGCVAFARELARFAMYLLKGYDELCRTRTSLPKLQEREGHIGVATTLAEMAAVVSDYLASKAARKLGDDYPGVFEYEVLEPMGAWFADHSQCSRADFCLELDRQFRRFMRAGKSQLAIPMITGGLTKVAIAGHAE